MVKYVWRFQVQSVNERPRGKKPPKNYTDSFPASSEQIAQELILKPIGLVHSTFKERYAAPRQPALAEKSEEQITASIELFEGFNFNQALKDLDQFSHIWVIYWMHLNQGWNPTVMPPRGPKTKRGVLATRAPHRPNSIGLSAVKLLGVQGRTLEIASHDMLDGTPVLDIKPYLPYADSIIDASHGWLENTDLIPS